MAAQDGPLTSGPSSMVSSQPAKSGASAATLAWLTPALGALLLLAV